jgi:hypothetical protein
MALLCSMDGAAKGATLSAVGLHHIITALGQKIGLKVRPNGLRHLAITKEIDKADGNYRNAVTYARHAAYVTTTIYDDKNSDFGVPQVIVDWYSRMPYHEPSKVGRKASDVLLRQSSKTAEPLKRADASDDF